MQTEVPNQIQEHPPLQQALPIVWPKDAQDVRDFFKADFISAQFAAEDQKPCDEDRYLISAHDFLSAVNWWANFPHIPRVDQAAPLPLLIRDIARDLGITALEACRALKDLGNFSVNMAVTAEMAAKLRELFPVPQAAPAAVAEKALLKVLHAIQRYMPPDGVNARDTLSEIIGIVDPWPLGDLPAAVAVPDGIAAFEKLLDASMAALTDRSSAKEHVQIWDDAHDALEAWKARAALAATPAAVEVPAEGDPAALLQLAYLIESGRGMNYVERKEIAVALRVLAATPAAAAPVVLPEPFALYDGEKWYANEEAAICSCADMAKLQKVFIESQLHTLLGGVSAPAAEGSVIRWVSNGLIGARPTTHDLREAIAVAEDCQRCDCTDCTKAMTLPLKLVEAINTAVGGNEWQGDALVTDLLEPACKVIANLTPRAQADQKARMKIAAALGHSGVNFAWSYLTGAIKELVKADGERLELQPQAQTFQRRVQPWMMACFGPEISADRIERNHRFLEEALELVQSRGCTASEAHQLVDYVFARPVGDPMQEAGGVMVTLAALCLASGLDMHACGETELARIWTKVEAIRAKQAAKPKHSPLPMHAPQTLDALRLAFVLSEIRRDGMDALGVALHDADGFPLDHKASLEAIDRAANAAASGK